ncbi:ArnT family glycosyltransferase [Ferruginibacter albus]|uniref:ArnT family glycosyltransferase n=1 Tax=Ferruginibacter albus TaxID=2875540 RepID=UPI001CC8007A|nr:glycosyltransferase family 39 protein [Ferruginibacter albus]UAY51473.1 glycosyltransferase family 39 protein [Ferruginibacter albus]
MDKRVVSLFVLLTAVYIIGFGIDIMDIDAAQYASISREMMVTKNFLQVHDMGRDYLDKPPFLFWISSLSMKLFGVNNFSYRFPSFLFALFSLYSTFQFCKLFYKKEIAVLSAIVLATCQAFFLINHDVRTDTILMSWVIFSIWQLAAWYKNNKLYHLLLASIGIAGGLITKGPIAVMVPVFAFGSHFILQRNFKVFFRWQYLLSILIIAVLLLPMCIGLYQQFDLHPEKIVNDKTGVSGLRFFFWTQSFGRITGESIWNNNVNIFFLLQNMLWSFLPWILFFLIAVVLEIKQLFTQRFKLSANQEWITTGGFLLTYLSLGLSHYQLPHYIFVVFPFAAIITAKFLYQLIADKKYPVLGKALQITHSIIFLLLWIVLLYLLIYCFSDTHLFTILLAVAGFMVFIFILIYKNPSVPKLLLICIYAILGINFFMNSSVYPSILKYQMGSNAGRFIHEHKILTDKVFLYQNPAWWSVHYYAQDIIKHKDAVSEINSGDWLLLSDDKLPDLNNAGKKYEIVYTANTFHVAMLTGQFLNPVTRNNVTKKVVIVRII